MIAEEKAYGHGFLFVPVLIGTGVALALEMPVEPPFWPIIALAGLLLLGLAVTRATSHPTRPITLGLLLVMTGMTLAGIETRRAATVMLDSPVTTMVTGIVERREPDGRGNWRYLLRLTQTADPILSRAPDRISILHRRGRAPTAEAPSFTGGQGFAMGDRIMGRARLSPPSGPALPELNDFGFSAYFDGIGAVGYFYGQPKKEASNIVGSGIPAVPLASYLFALRSAIADRIRSVVPGDAGAFAAAIVTDERRAISAETTEALRVAGLAHIIAISGLNRALAAGTFFFGLRAALALFPGFAQAWPIKKIAAAGALLMVTAYYLISGFGVSAERAYIMMAIMLGAVLVDRPSISLHNVALSALVVLVLSPSEILGPSFQMSFAATVALVAGYTAWQRRKRARPDSLDAPIMDHRLVIWAGRMSAGILGVAMTSLIGSLSTSIYSVEHFHRIATYGLAANLLSMPLISLVVMPMALAGMLLMPVGLDAPFLWLMGLGLDGVIAIARYVAGWGGDISVGRQHPWFLVTGTAGFLLLTLLRTRLCLLGLPLLVAAPLLSLQYAALPLPDLVVSEDGLLVGLPLADHSKERDDAEGPQAGLTMTLNRSKPPDFIYEQWRRALKIDGQPLSPLMATAEPLSDSDGMRARKRASPLPTPSISPAGDERRAIPIANAETLNGPEPNATSPASDPPVSPLKKAAPRKPPLTKPARAAAGLAMAEAPIGRFLCEKGRWCAATTPDGITLVTVEDIRYIGPACDAALLVIAPTARYDDCRSGALLISGKTLRRTGALEIFFHASPDDTTWTAKTAMAGQNRPWTRQRFYDWRNGTFDEAIPPKIAILIGRPDLLPFNPDTSPVGDALLNEGVNDNSVATFPYSAEQ